MTLPQVAQHPSSVEAYIRHGWSLVPIPPMTKGPTQTGWNQRQNTLQSQHQLPPGWGIGLAHAYSGTMALDIDKWDSAAFELLMQGIDLQALYDAPDAVIVHSGRAGRGKLLYAMPFGLVLPTKRVVREHETFYELRCGTANGLTTQDVLPPSIHPDTGQPYRWAGRGNFTRLPVIPQSLLTLWSKLLESPAPQQTDAAIDASWSEIESAVTSISPDCSREEWVAVGMALHYAGTQTENLEHAFRVWDEWSTPSHKYPGPREMAVQWRSFRTDKGTKVRLGTLFRMATKAGWSKPVPDVTAMFQAQGADPIKPETLTTNLRPPPPQLDMAVVPPALRNYVMAVSRGVGCDPMIPLFAGIAAVSGAVDARTRLELKPDFLVPPVVWAMVIGEPSAKKSHGAAPMFKVLHQLEKEDAPRFQQAMQQFEALEARHEMSRKAFLDAAKDTEALLGGEMPQGYGDAPVRPVPLTILGRDATSQKLVRQAAETPRGILMNMDEMLGWAERVTDRNSGEDRSAWTQAYEAGWYRMDRVGSGTVVSENFAISFFGNVQPEGIRKLLEPMAKDGMLQRFIPVVVQPELAHKGNPTRDTTARDAYEMMLRMAFGMPALNYRLSAGAAKVYDEFQDWYYLRVRDERLLRPGPIFMTAFGKMEGLVGRLALLWHMMTQPMSIEVPEQTMVDAVRVVRDYVVPSMRYVYEGEVGGFDQWCADYLIQYSDQPSITLSQIRRGARRQLEGLNQWAQIDKVLASMHTLEQARWVARVDDGKERDSAQWAINPALPVQFKDHRKRVIEAKQRRMDDIYKLSTKEKPKVYGYEDTEPQEKEQ